jgi:hypothetical protein
MVVRFLGRAPHVDPQLQDSDVLWRYLDAAKFWAFLNSQQLFLARGDQFEDKFEGAFTKSLRHAIEQSYTENKIEFTFEEFKQRLRERVFIGCWRLGHDDSMAMWPLYGKSECAVAITTTVGQLRQAVREANWMYETSIVKVQYVKHWRDPALNTKPYSNVFAYKVTAYEFENEARLIVDRFHETFEAAPVLAGLPMRVNPKTFLRSIVVAPEAPEWFRQLIAEACVKYGVSVDVRRSKLAFTPE